MKIDMPFGRFTISRETVFSIIDLIMSMLYYQILFIITEFV